LSRRPAAGEFRLPCAGRGYTQAWEDRFYAELLWSGSDIDGEFLRHGSGREIPVAAESGAAVRRTALGVMDSNTGGSSPLMLIYKRLTRPYLRALESRYRRMRRSISDDGAPWLVRSADYLFDRFDLAIIDHGVFRFIYANRHKVSDKAWRSSQPSPSDIAYFARRGVRTIVNLRGDRDCGSYRLERAACLRHGIELVDFKRARARAAPDRALFHDAKALFERIEYPMAMHCKSGADRAGLMTALYLIFQEGRPVEEARRALSLRYGHIRQAQTGILDAVFETYLAHNKIAPIGFLDWIDNHYDPELLTRNFRTRRWGNIVVDGILRRE
jgi:protein tyrosine/serine phosphatase